MPDSKPACDCGRFCPASVSVEPDARDHETYRRNEPNKHGLSQINKDEARSWTMQLVFVADGNSNATSNPDMYVQGSERFRSLLLFE
jgi:hypothetical protein